MDKRNTSSEVTYLVIPYEEKDVAIKTAGKLSNGNNSLGFDNEKKLWYANPGADLSKLKHWLPDPSTTSKTSETDPTIEFHQTLQSAGFILDEAPIMDGVKHRVRTEEDKAGQKSGVYVGYLDGIPAGWYQDHRNHEKPIKWKATGQKLDPLAHAHLRAQTAQRKQERDAKRAKTYNHNARRVQQAYRLMPEASASVEYLQKKGVKAYPGVKMDKRGRLVIPLQNENNEIRSIQRIDSTGFKLLKKNAQKAGHYFVIGENPLKNGEPILYAEGYSTSASVTEATGRPIVMAVDSGNMPHVAEKLKNLYPDSPHVFLGDDDRNNKINKGQLKAEEAAKLTGGVFRVPEFNEEEKKSGLTDFNDLHQSRGLEAVRNQVENAVSKISRTIDMSQENKDKEKQPVITEKMEQYIEAGLQKNGYEQIDIRKAIKDPNMHNSKGIKEIMLAMALKEDKKQGITTEERREILAELAFLSATKILTTKDKERIKQNSTEEENTVEPYIEKQQLKLSDNSLDDQQKESKKPAEKIQDHYTKTDQQLDSLNEEAITTEETLNINQKQPFVVPERIKKSYVEVSGKYYFSGRPDALAFVDKGLRLQTKHSNAQVAGSMVDIAEARGWKQIQVKGTHDFRREAWLEAVSRGLKVYGYKPRQEDLARLKQLSNKRQTNEIEAREQADQTPSRRIEQPRNETRAAQEPQEGSNQPQPGKPIDRLSGTLIAHGTAPYEHNKDNRESYYITLQNEDGKESTTWGIDLERAIKTSKAKEGQHIELKNLGRHPVTVEKPVKDEHGVIIRTETINTHRNEWDIKTNILQSKMNDTKELVREHPDLINEIAAIEMAEKFSQQRFTSDTDRERFMNGIYKQLDRDLLKGQKTPEIRIREERILEQEKGGSR